MVNGYETGFSTGSIFTAGLFKKTGTPSKISIPVFGI